MFCHIFEFSVSLASWQKHNITFVPRVVSENWLYRCYCETVLKHLRASFPRILILSQGASDWRTALSSILLDMKENNQVVYLYSQVRLYEIRIEDNIFLVAFLYFSVQKILKYKLTNTSREKYQFSVDCKCENNRDTLLTTINYIMNVSVTVKHDRIIRSP